MNEITLNAAELRLARYLAESRYSQNRAGNVENKLRAPGDPIEKEILGICGELAFCRLFNIYPDLSVGRRSKSDGTDNGDCFLASAGWIDVKTRAEPGDLLMAAPTAPSGHWYALMVGYGAQFRFLGAIPQVTALQPSNLRDYKTGKYYVVERAQLRPDFTLKASKV